jgi:hypothetical protein
MKLKEFWNLFRKPKRQEIMDFLQSIPQNPEYQKKIKGLEGKFLLANLNDPQDRVSLYLTKNIPATPGTNYPLYRIQLKTSAGDSDNYDGYAKFITGSASCGMGGMYDTFTEYEIERFVANLGEFKEKVIGRLKD